MVINVVIADDGIRFGSGIQASLNRTWKVYGKYRNEFERLLVSFTWEIGPDFAIVKGVARNPEEVERVTVDRVN